MRNPLRRYEKNPKVDAVLLESWKGYSIMKRVDELSGERIVIQNGKEKEEIYTGIIPNLIELNPDILPIPVVFKKMWIRKKWRLRVHHKLFDEPFTRDLYTGKILDPQKKKAVLIEKGFMDKEGFLLDKEGNRVKVDERAYIKVDVSDIDFIKAEYKAVNDSKLVEKSAESMSKTGMKLDDKFYILLGVSLITNVILVFIMSGGFASFGL